MSAPDVKRFLGKPFLSGAYGPRAYDCWGLTHTAARELFGLCFPPAVYASIEPTEVADAASAMLAAHPWYECASGKAGRVLALAGYDGRVRHVGLFIDERSVLHITRGLLSCVMPADKLTALYPVARVYAWVP